MADPNLTHLRLDLLRIKASQQLTPWLLGVLLLMLFAATATASIGHQKTQYNSSVGANQWVGIRLIDVPAKTQLSFSFSADGNLSLYFITEAAYRELPNIESPLFKTTFNHGAREALTFSVKAPFDGNYVLLIDNREGDTQKTFRLDLASNDPNLAKTKQQLKRFEKVITTAFEIDSFTIETKTCDKDVAGKVETAFAQPIVVCSNAKEYYKPLLPNDSLVADAVIFQLMHDSARYLLEQWQDPIRKNPEKIIELTAALATMFGQQERLLGLAAYIDEYGALNAQNTQEQLPSAKPESGHLIFKLDAVDKSQKLLSTPTNVTKWQPRLVPHMRSDFLQRLDKSNLDWVDHKAIKSELTLRANMQY